MRDQNDEIITREIESVVARHCGQPKGNHGARVSIVVAAAAFKISPRLNLKKGVNVSSIAISFARDFEVGVVARSVLEIYSRMWKLLPAK